MLQIVSSINAELKKIHLDTKNEQSVEISKLTNQNKKMEAKIASLQSISRSLLSKISKSRRKTDEKILSLIQKVTTKNFNLEQAFTQDTVLRPFTTILDHIETETSFEISLNILINLTNNEEILKKLSMITEEESTMIPLRAIELYDSFKVDPNLILCLIKNLSNEERNIRSIIKSYSIDFIAINIDYFEDNIDLIEIILKNMIKKENEKMIRKYSTDGIKTIYQYLKDESVRALIQRFFFDDIERKGFSTPRRFGITRVYT